MNEAEAILWAEQNLSEYFLTEKITEVIRRPAPVFGGKSALEMIMDGEEKEVKRLYDLILRYQG